MFGVNADNKVNIPTHLFYSFLLSIFILITGVSYIVSSLTGCCCPLLDELSKTVHISSAASLITTEH